MYRFSAKKIALYYIVSVNILYLSLYLMVPVYLTTGYPYINIFNYFTANIYGLLLIAYYQYFGFRKLYLLFFYITAFVLIVKFTFLMLNGNYFAFSADDSLDYNRLATHMAELPFLQSLHLLGASYRPDDWGFPFILHLLYHVYDSPVILSLFNILCVFLTINMLGYMGRQFMSRRAANFAALIFGCSQYLVFYSATGLKEVLMTTIIIAGFYFYFKYLSSKSSLYLSLSVLLSLLLVFFRVPLVFFILIAIIFNQILNSKSKYKYLTLTIFSVIAVVGLLVVGNLLFRYIQLAQNAGQVEQSRFAHGSLFNYAVAFISGIFGPLPTFVTTNGHVNSSIYAGSLFFKVLISPFFLIGAYQIFKNRNKYLVPLLVFSAFEILSLTYILETFEFRKSLPHMAFVIMIAVYTLEKWRVGRTTKALMKYGCVGGLIVLVLFWNLLRLH